MNRLTRVLMFSLVMALVTPGLALSQSTTSLSTEEMLLRIEENELWSLRIEADGTPYSFDFVQIVDGIPQMELNPSTQANYELFGVQDVHIHRTALFPNTDYYVRSSTGIETRILRLNNADDAAGYLNAAFDIQLEALELGESPDRQFTRVDPLPESENPVTGWTMMTATEYIDLATGQPAGYASSVRYFAQVENYVVSVEVDGPFVDYNFDIAWWLLQDAASCVQSSTACAPVPIPTGSGDYMYIGNVLYFLNTPEGVDGEVRWVFPVETPVRTPLFAVSFGDTAFAQQEEQTDATTDAEISESVAVAEEAPAGESGGTTATVIAATGNVRGEPSGSAPVVGVVAAGETVTVTGESTMADGYEWVPITTTAGVEGWIASTLIQMNE